MSSQEVHGALRILQAVQQALERSQAPQGNLPQTQRLVQLAKSIRATRSGRFGFFPAELFGEASWDILLALYVAEREGFKMKVSDVCRESGVPDTTALRAIERLKQLQLVSKARHQLDLRIAYVRLTSDGLVRVEEVLERAYKHFEWL